MEAVTGEWAIGESGLPEPGDDESLGFELNQPEAEQVSIPEVIGDYVIDHLIGSGGMGRVYLARHRTMDRIVAIKTLPQEQSMRSSAIERFSEEVRTAGKLLHPNIATAFDAGCSAGVHYLAMEYLSGGTLNQFVATHGPMSIHSAASAIRGAARGLAHAHAAGVIHRDVKPGNLMISADGTIKVVDLGLACFSNPSLAARRDAAERRPGKLIGTIAYMSPEQLENPDQVDMRSDIYSLGATLYFLLTGRPPYEGEFLEQIRAIRHDPVPDLFAVRSDVDLRLEHIFRRMMAKRPQERYASLTEVISDLAAYDSADSITPWLNQISGVVDSSELSSYRGGSTMTDTTKIMSIDLGMFYATCASTDSAGNVALLFPEGNTGSQTRLAIANSDPLMFGNAAAQLREHNPGSVLHCLQLYFGQNKIDQVIHERQCPAEVLMAMLLRKLVESCWTERGMPEAVAITVPATYNQFYRQSILQAARIAGMKSVRLVDRSMAVLQARKFDALGNAADRLLHNQPIEQDAPQVVLSITGIATDVVIARERAGRMQQLAAVGRWHHGKLQWQQRLVDLVAEQCLTSQGFDPRHFLQTAVSLQIACEQAMPKFLLLDNVNIIFQRGQQPVAIAVSREQWFKRCESLHTELMELIEMALSQASVRPDEIGTVSTLGLLTRLQPIRHSIEQQFCRASIEQVERADAARGAALCIAGELPGRGDVPLPPQMLTSHDFGLLVVDAQRRRRIRPIIPRGTVIPARTNRRIATGTSLRHTLTLVESSEGPGGGWRSLGSHRIELDDASDVLEVTFEIDIDGQLIVRRRDIRTGRLTTWESLPKLQLDATQEREWSDWIDEWVPLPRRRPSSRT